MRIVNMPASGELTLDDFGPEVRDRVIEALAQLVLRQAMEVAG